MLRTVRCGAALGIAAVAVAFLAGRATPPAGAQGGKYSIKIAKAAPPGELKSDVAKLLDGSAIQLHDGSGNLIVELWPCTALTADATAEQVKNGLTYRELKETTLLGVIKVHKQWSDYRKQKVKPGVYTLRLGFQPEDGDHAGSSEHKEFVVLVAAAKDTRPAPLEPKAMIEMSMKSIDTGHPAVLMLFPNNKPKAAPELVGKERDHWVINFKEEVTAAGMKTQIGFGLTVAGHAE